MNRHPALLLLCATLLPGAAACNRVGAAPADGRLVASLEGFSFPESVRYDPRQDVFFVSSIDGFGSVRDGRAHISRIRAGELARIETFVQSGVNGVVLHAPKGMAIQGDTLWVADIDALRGFHRRTGAPVGAVDLRSHGARLLNDVALGPDGALYVTDTGIDMSAVGVGYVGGSRIFRIAGGRASVFAAGPELSHPNGITWDAVRERWLVVTFHPFVSELYALTATGEGPVVLAHGTGRYDGVEVLRDGRVLVTSWSDSSLHVFDGRESRRVVRGIWQPADLGVDTRRGRIAIPLVLQGRVQLWELPR